MNKYSNVEQVETDFSLLCTNARHYNQEGSLVYIDSEHLRWEFYHRMKTVTDLFELSSISFPEIGTSGML